MTVLYRTLAHPPSAFVGSDSAFGTKPSQPIWPNDKRIADGDANGTIPPAAQGAPIPRSLANFRSADGGGNNPFSPDLGRAGQPYARSVQSKHPLPANTLPDPGQVFDALLKARDVSLRCFVRSAPSKADHLASSKAILEATLR